MKQSVSCVRVPPTQYHVGHARVCHPGSASRRLSVTASLGSASRRFYPSMLPWPSVIATRRCWFHHDGFTRQGGKDVSLGVRCQRYCDRVSHHLHESPSSWTRGRVPLRLNCASSYTIMSPRSILVSTVHVFPPP